MDFDGTIATVPTKPDKAEAKRIGWDGRDWWGSEVSLRLDSIIPNEEVISAMKADKTDPQTKVLLITGRRGVVAHLVRAFLRSQELYGKRMIPESNKDALRRFQQGIEADKDLIHPEESYLEYFCGDMGTEEDFPKGKKGKPLGDTIVHKKYVIDKHLNGIKKLEFWEDRDDHVPFFIRMGLDWLKKGRVEEVLLHKVYEVSGNQPYVRHIPIEPGMNY